ESKLRVTCLHAIQSAHPRGYRLWQIGHHAATELTGIVLAPTPSSRVGRHCADVPPISTENVRDIWQRDRSSRDVGRITAALSVVITSPTTNRPVATQSAPEGVACCERNDVRGKWNSSGRPEEPHVVRELAKVIAAPAENRRARPDARMQGSRDQ